MRIGQTLWEGMGRSGEIGNLREEGVRPEGTRQKRHCRMRCRDAHIRLRESFHGLSRAGGTGYETQETV